MIDAAGIRRLLPHRYPILLVDRVVELVEGERLTALKAVTLNEPCYQHLREDAPAEAFAYPASLLIESWGQSAGLLAVHGGSPLGDLEGQVMLAGATSGVTFHRPVHPGDVLEHRVRTLRALSDTVMFEGESLVAGETAVTFTGMVMAFRHGGALRPEAAGAPEESYA